ncbi:AAA family ATPase [uncultured Duncaniella sp.]|uniref:AAA family ATPase n=1 Tax=uncultured Duncaniella sp. TaxID=2768039 RepID=UPI0025AA1FB7|nr:AAA family ATPase [uncultured Duncaniella sp.]
MKFGIDGFKSIGHLAPLDLARLTVLAGTNSSGKSSYIQAILLLKQTLEEDSNSMLKLDGPLFYAASYADIMKDKKLPGNILFSLSLDETEILNQEDWEGVAQLQKIERLDLNIDFKLSESGVLLNKFSLDVRGYERFFNISFTKSREKDAYSVEYSHPSLILPAPERPVSSKKLGKAIIDADSFRKFFPVFAERNGVIHSFPVVKVMRETLGLFFKRISYIGPLRVKPVLRRSYNTNVPDDVVLPDGENTRFILNNHQSDRIMADLRKWVCDRFGLSKDIDVIKTSNKEYRVIVEVREGLKVDLVQMGLGLSQILPIITQGLISKPGSIFIVEDPDVHMHPGIQAAIADFFIFLKKERKVCSLIETHSEHFVTRLRRRIAEQAIYSKYIDIIFVEHFDSGSSYTSITVTPNGRFEGDLPPGFCDSQDEDFRAIIKARKNEIRCSD